MSFSCGLTTPSFSPHMTKFGSDGKESACNEGDLSWIPGSRISPGGGHGLLKRLSALKSLQDKLMHLSRGTGHELFV